MDIKLYGVFHKPSPYIIKDWLQPVGVGGYNNEEFLLDNTGKNIAELNSNFCELTVQYWVRHNIKHDYVGFYHYRRYFDFTGGESVNHLPIENQLDHCSSDDQLVSLQSILKNYDAVMMSPYQAGDMSMTQQYLQIHANEPWHDMIAMLRQIGYTQDQIEYFDRTFRYGTCNMYVMPWQMFCDYTDQMFEIFLKLYEKHSEHPRCMGFLGERFLDFWMETNHIKYFPAHHVRLDL